MINIGIIGIGYMGNHYLKVLNIIMQLPEYKDKIFIKKIADPNYAKLIPLKEKFNIPEITANPEEITYDGDIQAVFVSSPPFFHYEQAMAAIKNGKAVYCEKPLTISSNLSFKLSKEAERNNVKNQVGLTLRYSPSISFVKEIIDKEEYGKVKFVNWVHDAQYSLTNQIYHTKWRKNVDRFPGGKLKECNVHDLDLILYLFDIKKYPKIDYFYEAKDYYHFKMKYKNIEIVFTAIWHKILGRRTKRRFEIFFDKAVLFAEDFFTYGNVKFFSSMGKMKTYFKDEIFDNYIKENGLPEVLRVYKRLYSFIPVFNFLNCILNDKKPSPSFKDCARAEKLSEILTKK